MKRWIAGIVTAALVLTVLVIARRRGPLPTSPSSAEKPEACIERMFDAAGEGDVQTYLDCFTGSERERLERELADQPRDAFARSLVEAVDSLKGRAIFEAKTDGESESNRVFTVERIYLNRYERQKYHLVRESTAWRIRTVEAAAAFQPDKPYGTPVYEPPPDEENPEQ